MSRSFGNWFYGSVQEAKTLSRRWLARCVGTLVAVLVALAATTGVAAAAVEVNNADQSQLETVKGIGPALSSKILAARKQGGFKDWSDLQSRVSGVGEKNSAGFSRNGLVVAGRAKDGADATPGGGAARSARTASKKPSGDVAVASASTSGKKSP